MFEKDSGTLDELDEIQDGLGEIKEDFAEKSPSSKASSKRTPSGKRIAPETTTSQTEDHDDVEGTDAEALTPSPADNKRLAKRSSGSIRPAN